MHSTRTPNRPLNKSLGRPMRRPVRPRAEVWAPPGLGTSRARVASPAWPS